MHSADESDLAGPGDLSCQDAREERAFVLAEDDRAHVGQRGRLARLVEHGTVDEQELRAWIVARHLADRRLHHEPHPDDELSALRGEER